MPSSVAAMRIVISSRRGTMSPAITMRTNPMASPSSSPCSWSSIPHARAMVANTPTSPAQRSGRCAAVRL